MAIMDRGKHNVSYKYILHNKPKTSNIYYIKYLENIANIILIWLCNDF